MISEREVEELYRSIIDIRNSLELPLQMRSIRSPVSIEEIKIIALKLEEIRLDLMAARRGGDDQPIAMLRKVQIDLRNLIDRPDFRTLTSSMRLRQLRNPSDGPLDLSSQRVTVVEAAEDILVRVDNAIRAEYSPQIGLTVNFDKLLRIVPEQKIAPAVFDIIDGKLIVRAQTSHLNPVDEINVERAKDALLGSGENIIVALERSNCDRRILESMRELQAELGCRDNVIRLGLMNMAVERVCKGAAAELPEALLGAIEGQTAGIGMYVAQFPAWQRFSENAASVELDTADIARIAAATQETIASLIAQPQIADEEVPATLRALKFWLSDPALATKRAAFATLRTLENLVAKIFQYGAEFLDQTATKTISGLSSAASHAMIGSLLAVALAATANLGGVTEKVAEASWMKTATAIVKAQLDEAILNQSKM